MVAIAAWRTSTGFTALANSRRASRISHKHQGARRWQFYAALRPRVHAVLRLPHWEYCSPAELRLVSDSFNAVQQLIHHLKRARRIDPALVRLLPIALHWLKALGYQLADLRHFQRQHLSMGEGWL